MKKGFTTLLALTMVLLLAACGGRPSSTLPEETDKMETSGTEEREETEGKETNEVEESTVETDAEEESTEDTLAEPSEDETSEDNNDVPEEEIRPEFKEAMDAYEAFYEEYCSFMKKYLENPADLKLLAEYANMMSKAEDMNKAFEAWDEDELSDKEVEYYLDVNNRVMKMLADLTD